VEIIALEISDFGLRVTDVQDPVPRNVNDEAQILNTLSAPVMQVDNFNPQVVVLNGFAVTLGREHRDNAVLDFPVPIESLCKTVDSIRRRNEARVGVTHQIVTDGLWVEVVKVEMGCEHQIHIVEGCLTAHHERNALRRMNDVTLTASGIERINYHLFTATFNYESLIADVGNVEWRGRGVRCGRVR
jgi:hypothetical protein